MSPQRQKTLGMLQLWMSGYAVGFGIAALVAAQWLLVMFLPLGAMLFVLGHQNLTRVQSPSPFADEPEETP